MSPWICVFAAVFNDSVSSFVVLFNTSPIGCRLPVSFDMGEDIDLLNPLRIQLISYQTLKFKSSVAGFKKLVKLTKLVKKNVVKIVVTNLV